MSAIFFICKLFSCYCYILSSHIKLATYFCCTKYVLLKELVIQFLQYNPVGLFFFAFKCRLKKMVHLIESIDIHVSKMLLAGRLLFLGTMISSTVETSSHIVIKMF